MSRLFKLGFGLLSYAFFLLVFLYAIGFTGSVAVPKTIDSGSPEGLMPSILIDVVLLSLFAVQHSVMARPGFKRWWTRMVPPAIERSVFVLLASLALALLFSQWRPLPDAVWTLTGNGAVLMIASFWFGWGLVLLSTFLISHFELFGVRQVLLNWFGKALPTSSFKTPALYNYVRHPIYLGFIIAFWSAPTMSWGHLMFAVVTSLYILVGIQLEERDLVHYFGDAYASYRRRVGMLLPSFTVRRASGESRVPGVKAN